MTRLSTLLMDKPYIDQVAVLNPKNLQMMAKSVLGVLMMTTAIVTTGCQMFTGYKTIDQTQANQSSVGADEKVSHFAGEVSIACGGLYHCDITQIDKQQLISSETHQPLSKDKVVSADHAIPKSGQSVKTIKLTPSGRSKLNNLTRYYARVLPSKHEVHVDFYPEDNDQYSERFAIIHDFDQPGVYRLQAYRMPSNSQAAGSLLATASPTPLCVALTHNEATIRRFCKLPIDSRQNEFIEVTGIDTDTIIEALLAADEAEFSDKVTK